MPRCSGVNLDGSGKLLYTIKAVAEYAGCKTKALEKLQELYNLRPCIQKRKTWHYTENQADLLKRFFQKHDITYEQIKIHWEDDLNGYESKRHIRK